MVSRASVLLFALAGSVRFGFAQASAPFFVEVLPLPSRVFAQQVVPVVVRVGFDATFVRDAAVPLSAQPLDQPFQLVVPWLAPEPSRVVAVVPPAADVRTQRLAVGDQMLALAVGDEIERDGRRFQLLELRTTVRSPGPGPVALPGPSVRYAFATRFVEDFLRGRQGVDRQEGTVAGPGVAWTAEPLPTPTPAGFAGAVGAFELAAVVPRPNVAVGDSFPVDVVVRGDGDLAGLPSLPTPTLPGFHVQGVVERRGPDRTVFTLDVLALRAGEVTLPGISFVAFAPKRAAYVTHTTAAMPLRVAPAAGALPDRIARLVAADVASVQESAERGQGSGWARSAWMVAVFVPFLAAAARRRRRRREAIADLRRAVASDPSGVVAAFEAVLALQAGKREFTTATWADLAKRMPPAAIAGLRAAHARLEEARFGGVPMAWSELEQALAQARIR
jgi:hypothetical protein